MSTNQSDNLGCLSWLSYELHLPPDDIQGRKCIHCIRKNSWKASLVIGSVVTGCLQKRFCRVSMNWVVKKLVTHLTLFFRQRAQCWLLDKACFFFGHVLCCLDNSSPTVYNASQWWEVKMKCFATPQFCSMEQCDLGAMSGCWFDGVISEGILVQFRAIYIEELRYGQGIWTE